ALLAAELKRAPELAPGGWEVWRTELALQLEPEARRLLWERSQGGPLEVAARAEVPGKASAELTLRLLCQEDIFKGLIAIDFGTSNWPFPLYDRGVVEALPGLAPERENRLKELLLIELMDEDCNCKLPDADPQAWRGLIERVGGNLAGDGAAAQRFKAALRAGGQRMFEAVRQLEICLGARPDRGGGSNAPHPPLPGGAPGPAPEGAGRGGGAAGPHLPAGRGRAQGEGGQGPRPPPGGPPGPPRPEKPPQRHGAGRPAVR